jgi:hypothetical protein
MIRNQRRALTAARRHPGLTIAAAILAAAILAAAILAASGAALVILAAAVAAGYAIGRAARPLPARPLPARPDAATPPELAGHAAWLAAECTRLHAGWTRAAAYATWADARITRLAAAAEADRESAMRARDQAADRPPASHIPTADAAAIRCRLLADPMSGARPLTGQ